MVKQKFFTVDFTQEELSALSTAFFILTDIAKDDEMPTAVTNLANQAADCIDQLYAIVEDCTEFTDEGE